MLFAVLALAFLLRVGVLWSRSENLSDDRDAYLSVAEGIWEGRGFSNGVTGEPTAYRPPLYPLLLAAAFSIEARDFLIALAHLLAGMATVWLTWRIGRQLGLERGASTAALIVAMDPLLLQYTTFPMTETIFTFLLTAWLVLATRNEFHSSHAEDRRPAGTPGGRRTGFALGVLFGLCTLCRPTVWAVGLLTAGWWLTTKRRAESWRATAMPVVIGIAVVVAPWLVRNVVVFGKPIVTTTHGGYTLLLGNNPVFYREVVDKPLGTVWDDAPDDRSQQTWYQQVKHEMAADLGDDATESAQDRWMYRRAFKHIAEEPTLFLRACGLRFVRFWNVVPLGNARSGVPRLVVFSVGAYYLAVLAGFLCGVAALRHTDWRRWMPLVLAIVGFCLVHLVFWTDTRMRAPVIPAIALIVGLWVERPWRRAGGPAESTLADQRK